MDMMKHVVLSMGIGFLTMIGGWSSVSISSWMWLGFLLSGEIIFMLDRWFLRDLFNIASKMSFGTLVSADCRMDFFEALPEYYPFNNTQCSEADYQELELESEALIREQLLENVDRVIKRFEEISQNLISLMEVDVLKSDLYLLLDQVCDRVCQHCNGYEACWGEHFYSTYREFFDLLARAELEGEIHGQPIKGKLGKKCFQQFKLICTVNQLLEESRNEQICWDDARFKTENKDLFVDEAMFKELSGLIFTDKWFKRELEIMLKTGLNRAGIFVKELVLDCFEGVGFEVWVKQKLCNRQHQCQKLVTNLLEQILGTPFIVWEKRCNLGQEECVYCLIPQRKYNIKTTICKLPKAGNEFSGDSHALHELKDGFFVSILSDGMGHGSRAALESNSTVNILEDLLDGGIDRNFAVKMVNSMMELRSPEELFATVDLAAINLYTGEAEFIKVGAASTYVKRGNEIRVIRSTSLPAGILNTIDIEKTSMQLMSGDLVVMITDGITESKSELFNGDQWMERALSKVEVSGPEALGQYLLNLAKVNQAGVPKDDMTVIVIQVEGVD